MQSESPVRSAGSTKLNNAVIGKSVTSMCIVHCLCSTALPFPPTCKRDKPCVSLWSRYLISQALHYPGSYALLIRLLFFFHFLYIIFVHSVHLCYYYNLANRPILFIYGKVIMNQPLAVQQYSQRKVKHTD